MSEAPAPDEPLVPPEAQTVGPETDNEKDAEIARLRAENAALAKGEEAKNERPIVQVGHELVQEQADGSVAVVGVASPPTSVVAAP